MIQSRLIHATETQHTNGCITRLQNKQGNQKGFSSAIPVVRRKQEAVSNCVNGLFISRAATSFRPGMLICNIQDCVACINAFLVG